MLSTIFIKETKHRKKYKAKWPAIESSINVAEQENMTYKNKTENKMGSRLVDDHNAKIQTGLKRQ